MLIWITKKDKVNDKNFPLLQVDIEVDLIRFSF